MKDETWQHHLDSLARKDLFKAGDMVVIKDGVMGKKDYICKPEEPVEVLFCNICCVGIRTPKGSTMMMQHNRLIKV